jgi:REP element-mobilizing transposase RayT
MSEEENQFVEAASCRLKSALESTRQDAASTNIAYFDPQQPVAELLGNLPHWRQEVVTYFVTFRLADSIPQEKLRLWQRQRDDWLKRHPEPHTHTQREEYYRLFVDRFHKWLDAGYGDCVLAMPTIRKIVADALPFFENDRYLLREWVVMPNHVHAIVTPLPGYELSETLQGWKSFTAKAINKQLGKKGTLWQKESFDHIVRRPDQLERIEHYIHNNPKHLPPDHFTLRCLHQFIEAASCRFNANQRIKRQDAASTNIEQRYGQWLASQDEAGVTFSPEQRRWLDAIKNHIASSLYIEQDNFDDLPFNQMGGLGRAYELFGDGLNGILKELNEGLAA